MDDLRDWGDRWRLRGGSDTLGFPRTLERVRVSRSTGSWTGYGVGEGLAPELGLLKGDGEHAPERERRARRRVLADSVAAALDAQLEARTLNR